MKAKTKYYLGELKKNTIYLLQLIYCIWNFVLSRLVSFGGKTRVNALLAYFVIGAMFGPFAGVLVNLWVSLLTRTFTMPLQPIFSWSLIFGVFCSTFSFINYRRIGNLVRGIDSNYLFYIDKESRKGKRLTEDDFKQVLEKCAQSFQENDFPGKTIKFKTHGIVIHSLLNEISRLNLDENSKYTLSISVNGTVIHSRKDFKERRKKMKSKFHRLAVEKIQFITDGQFFEELKSLKNESSPLLEKKKFYSVKIRKRLK